MKLIDKSALVAEIERLEEGECPCDTFEGSTWYYNALDEITTFLDTLEVKEVELEKEISSQWSKFCLNGKDRESFVKVAKHFFELGMSASNKAHKGE